MWVLPHGSGGQLLLAPVPAEVGSPEGQTKRPGLGEASQGTAVTAASCPGSGWRAASPFCWLIRCAREQVLDKFPHEEAAPQVFIVTRILPPPPNPRRTNQLPGKSPRVSNHCHATFQGPRAAACSEKACAYQGETEAQRRGVSQATQICGKTRPWLGPAYPPSLPAPRNPAPTEHAQNQGPCCPLAAAATAPPHQPVSQGWPWAPSRPNIAAQSSWSEHLGTTSTLTQTQEQERFAWVGGGPNIIEEILTIGHSFGLKGKKQLVF